MRSKLLLAILLGCVCYCPALLAVEYPDAKVIKTEPGKVTFVSQEKEHTLPIGLDVKFYGLNGKELPLEQGVGMVQPGNVLQIVAGQDDATPQLHIVFVRLISGKIPNLDTAKVSLLPDPNFKDEVGKPSLPDNWLDYFPTAKVGDFAEYHGFGRVRYEVLAVTEDSVTVARVVDTRGTRHEFHDKFSLTAAQKKQLAKQASAAEEKPQPKPKPKTTASKTKKKLTPAQERAQKAKEEREAALAKKNEPKTETLRIDGQELLCNVEETGKSSALWTSPLVPFDHLVRRKAPNDDLQLVKFGRGK